MEETQDIEYMVAKIYIAAFNRVPDSGGLSNWVNQRVAGVMDYDQIAQAFTNQDEYIATYGSSLSNSEYVSLIYVNVFGRAADSSGLQNWTNQLDYSSVTGFDRGNIMKAMLDVASTAGNTDGIRLENQAKFGVDAVKAGYAVDKATTLLSQITSDISTITTTNSLFSDNIKPTIERIQITDGNYTTAGIVDIVVTFNEDIVVSGSDSTVGITIGSFSKQATYSSKTSNSITYKYTIEDGISATEQTITVNKNALTLNNSTIRDTSYNNVDLTNASTTNTSAVVNDNKAPSITINSFNYTSSADRLEIFGSGFSTIVEQDEDASTDVANRFDFTKLIWDIDGDYDTIAATDADSTVANVILTSSSVASISILDDNNIFIILSSTFAKDTLEAATNYGYGTAGVSADTVDILTGFVKDKADNLSTDAIKDNIRIAIDGEYWGDTSANTIKTSSNTDTIYANSGNDIIYGEAGNDVIYGEAGDDVIYGGLGIDTISGGIGNDRFVFDETTTDSIASFSSVEGIDKIIDLTLDGNSADLIDIKATVKAVNATVSGSASQATFIDDINTLLAVQDKGFDTQVARDVSSSLVSITSGNLSGKTYLVADIDANDAFSINDFVVDVTGLTVINFNTLVFV